MCLNKGPRNWEYNPTRRARPSRSAGHYERVAAAAAAVVEARAAAAIQQDAGAGNGLRSMYSNSNTPPVMTRMTVRRIDKSLYQMSLTGIKFCSTMPVFYRAWPVAYGLRERIDAKLDAMLRTGAIEPVDHSD
ncbi:hypothetical protein EVAR_77810_1 [Eumeta japonica]|uniref:Uncharacterized protein n=1 Tax=Eumeta variegata TaxID=151549 RepID=A0A4C1TB10_EUMVA|nr:hypothetical protein EVAR_77810_1 [Eumeta japonica]